MVTSFAFNVDQDSMTIIDHASVIARPCGVARYVIVDGQ